MWEYLKTQLELEINKMMGRKLLKMLLRIVFKKKNDFIMNVFIFIQIFHKISNPEKSLVIELVNSLLR